jgi:starvation-inducible DNA-binding protein
MTQTTLTELMPLLLSDTYGLYTKTQNYHWNVTGPNFSSLHELFGKQYEDMAEAIDTLAELIRGRGFKVAASLSYFSENSKIKSGNENASWDNMLKELAKDHGYMEDILGKVISIAQDTKDEVIADALIDRQAFHRKARWMLESSL